MKIILENPLVVMGMQDLVKKSVPDNEWSIRKDRDGVDMIFYKDVPVDEIIYCLGEISLAMPKGLHFIQKEYYSCDAGDVFNIALKLIRDNVFAEEFYLKYELLKEKL